MGQRGFVSETQNVSAKRLGVGRYTHYVINACWRKWWIRHAKTDNHACLQNSAVDQISQLNVKKSNAGIGKVSNSREEEEEEEEEEERSYLVGFWRRRRTRKRKEREVKTTLLIFIIFMVPIRGETGSEFNCVDKL